MKKDTPMLIPRMASGIPLMRYPEGTMWIDIHWWSLGKGKSKAIIREVKPLSRVTKIRYLARTEAISPEQIARDQHKHGDDFHLRTQKSHIPSNISP